MSSRILRFPRLLDRPGIAGLALRLLAALSISILPGCAALQPSPVERWPATDPAPIYAVEDIRPAPGLGGEPAPDPASTERLLALALQEWQLWGRGRWDAATNLTERRLDEPRGLEAEPYLHARVLLYWLGVKGGDFPVQRTRHEDGSLRPWSAVFISWLMRGAGFGERQFEAAELHWQYIRAALDHGVRAGFEARDAAATAPRPGDLICAPRDATPDAPSGFAQWSALARPLRARAWPWHCDLVVQVDGAELGAIGGNVSDSVTWTRTPLDAAGRLVPTPERPWTVVLRQKGAPP